MGLDRPVTQTYKNLLTKLPGGSTVLENAYSVIEKTISCVDAYVKEWLDYQSLWDLQPDALVIKFGEDISKWMRLLSDIKKSRDTSDTSEAKKQFGPVVIDSWHKDVLGKFGSLLGTEMADFHGNISKARSELEQQTINMASTSEAMSFITYSQGLKRKMWGWEKQVDVYREGQRILERQRFQFPDQWLHVGNIDGEWGAFNKIMRRKDSSIQNQVNSLQVKIIAEDKAMERRPQNDLAEWEKNKPVKGALQPDEALQTPAIFELKCSWLKKERKAKEALKLEEAGPSRASEDRVVLGWEELQDLNSVWINQIKAKMEETKIAATLPGQEILIQSVCETMEPKLVAEDISLLSPLNNLQEQEVKHRVRVKEKQSIQYKMKELVNNASKSNVYGSALLLIKSGIEVNPGPTFDISKVQSASRKIWNNAGQLMDVPTDQCYTYEDMEVCSPSLLSLLENILKNELKVPFRMKKYQEVTLQAMSRHRDVIVISPPGSGKSLSTYAGASMLRKLESKPAGVVLHLVPYNSIIKDKVTNPWLPTGYIMMGGATGGEEVVTEDRAAEDRDEGDIVTMDFTIQDLQEGKLSVIVCHPESLLSKKGDEILKYLLRNDLLLSVMVDEFHKILYWGCTEEELTGKQKEAFSVAFRPGMKKVVRKLKSLTKNIPFVFETATLMEKEIEFARKTFNIKNPCIIKTSPIQQQHCYLNLRRPDQGVPWDGDTDDDGNHISGLKDVIMELVLKPYIAMVKSEEPVHQKIMVFAKNRATLDKIDQELSVLLPEESRLLPDKSPWYLNHLIVLIIFCSFHLLQKKCVIK